MHGIDIGCVDDKRMGFIGVGIRRTKVVDVMADARKLPFIDCSFDHVYSSHSIKHFSYQEVKNFFSWMGAFIEESGILEIRCSDLHARALLFFFNISWQKVINIWGTRLCW
jgi:predicted SAM-dependent methyltransferase